ncbi:MAG: type I methionyl aminopeptidase [Candidatus Doudnabacteria bacterium RIFCSPHIGHO2_01_FULL_50_11]|uniref:Methionine aminopeptidase n=1 Tax=Candidatus Doudnabacteria bacterium RIFCSPHIGHO2_01_FULL_50_11 TaxID=1817828 RepID=A0A1F5PNF4_9BACT|nr:MAG: type I methionyl aminopeptidase [Candidatus Doudnabacteria bacterium RIFCSPHIGHO2_01_FULL_50_11]HLC44677.1 type I methionyl aminopeptidase [Patescibacteria group bacterium]
MVNIYSPDEIKLLQKSGAILSRALHAVAASAVVGITTLKLDALAERSIRAEGGAPAFLGYHEKDMRPYPASLCTSINEELVHCIPSRGRTLKSGDIVGLDLGVEYKGFITDMAITVAVGPIELRIQKLLDVTQECLARAIAIARPGATTGDIGHAVQGYAESQGFGVIRDLVGHGVGRAVHEDPKVPNYGNPGEGLALREGMVLAIEPMISMGGFRIKMLSDGWGIAMADGSLCAHFEKTVAITDLGSLVLTP